MAVLDIFGHLTMLTIFGLLKLFEQKMPRGKKERPSFASLEQCNTEQCQKPRVIRVP